MTAEGDAGDAAVGVRRVEVEQVPLAVVAATTTWAEFPSRWRPMLDQVWAFLRGGGAPAGLHTGGHNVMVYRDDRPTVEVGVQVNGSFDAAGEVVPSASPGGAAATGRATVARIGEAHDAVCRWCDANGHRRTGVRWEVYGDPDPGTGQVSVDVFWELM